MLRQRKALLVGVLMVAPVVLGGATFEQNAPALVAAPATQPAPDPMLLRLETRLRMALKDLGPDVRYLYPAGPGTLEVHFKTRRFLVHSSSMTGEFSEEAHPRTGPSHRGFLLRVSLQKAGEANQAVTPQTLNEPYWRTFLDVAAAPGAPSQLFWGFSYGGGVSADLLAKIRTEINQTR